MSFSSGVALFVVVDLRMAASFSLFNAHQTQFSIDIFTVAVVKKVSPQRLRREEFKYIDKYQTNSLGLNRYKV